MRRRKYDAFHIFGKRLGKHSPRIDVIQWQYAIASRPVTRRVVSHLLQVPVEPSVETAICNQLLMIPVFGDAPAIEHQHAIGLFHR